MAQPLSGVWTASLTPLNPDQSVNAEALVAHYRHLLDQGCDGVAALGTTGEANSFSVRERLALIETVATAGFTPNQIMVGTGCCALPDTIELTKAALAAGYCNILMLPPFYYKGIGDEAMYATFAEIIERVGDDRLQIYIYDFPKMAGVDISLDVLARLRETFPETVMGVKDSSGDWPKMQAVCDRLPGFGMFAGTEQFLLPVLRAGGVGCISATANVTCHLAAEVYAQRQEEAAGELQDALTATRLALQQYPPVPALKEIIAARSDDSSWRTLRRPLANLSEADTGAVLALAREHGLLS